MQHKKRSDPIKVSDKQLVDAIDNFAKEMEEIEDKYEGFVPDALGISFQAKR